MREIKFRVWHSKDQKMYFRGYQKLFHVLLCENDFGAHDGKGIPVKRVSYDECELLEATDVMDKNGREIYEGDVVRIHTNGNVIEGVVGGVPDMYRSRKLHPLHQLFKDNDISDDAEGFEIEVIGNIYEMAVATETVYQ